MGKKWKGQDERSHMAQGKGRSREGDELVKKKKQTNQKVKQTYRNVEGFQ